MKKTFKIDDVVVLENGSTARIVDMPVDTCFAGMLIVRVIMPDGKLGKMYHSINPKTVNKFSK